MPRRAVEGALRKLQAGMRSSHEKPVTGGLTKPVPADLAPEDGLTLLFDQPVAAAIEAAESAVRADLHLEYLQGMTADEVWRFACLCHLQRSTNHVPAFLARLDHDIQTQPVLFPVRDLEVDSAFDFAGATFLPLASESIPEGSDLDQDPAYKSLVQVEVSGTDKDSMVDRGRRKAEHALNVLRISLRRHNAINDRQLRFRAASRFALGPTYSGWAKEAGTGYPLAIESTLKEFVEDDILATISSDTNHDVEKRVLRALKWMERARFEDDLLVACLFLFFALEALLGDESEGEKATHLCFYRSVLGDVTGHGFRHPFRTYLLYAHVRSKAVHGGEAAEVSADTVKKLEWDVRDAVYQIMEFSRANNIARHARVLQALREHEIATQAVVWLEANFPSDSQGRVIDWARFTRRR